MVQVGDTHANQQKEVDLVMVNFKFVLFIIIFTLVLSGVAKLIIESNLWPSSEFGKAIAGLCLTLLYVVGGSKMWGVIKDKDDICNGWW